MDLLHLIVLLAVIAIVGYVAYWIITKFFPAPVQMPALLVIGIILLCVLVYAFFPGVANFRVTR